VGGLITIGLLIAWQWLFSIAFVPLVRASFPANQANAAIWAISLFGAYALYALFIYVPVVALRPDIAFVKALREGVGEGVKLFRWTILFVIAFSLPALPFLMAMQLATTFMVTRMRPEMIVVVTAIYTTLISLGTYLTYAAAARLHWASAVEEA
jgi:hypothetical protein